MCEQCIEATLIAREREIVPEVETSTGSPESGQEMGARNKSEAGRCERTGEQEADGK